LCGKGFCTLGTPDFSLAWGVSFFISKTGEHANLKVGVPSVPEGIAPSQKEEALTPRCRDAKLAFPEDIPN